MRFAFDEDQLEFRDQLRFLAEKRCTPADLRAAWESEHGWSPDRWRALGDLGVLGVTVPAEHGGLGLGFVDLVLLLEEAGYRGLPEPLAETGAVAVPLVVALSSEAGSGLAARWLPGVVSGDVALGCGLPGLKRTFVSGVDLALVMDEGRLYGVEPSSVDSGERRSIDGARRLRSVPAALPDSAVVASGEQARRLWRAACDRGGWAAAAELCGVADRLVSMTADYARERVQFAKPIGSFQAVKHHLADARIAVEFARPLVYRAALSLDLADPDASPHASMAKAAASDAASLAAAVALQVHGAIGYTWEHDLHLWMKRAWSLAGAWGDAGWHRARLLGLLDW